METIQNDIQSKNPKDIIKARCLEDTFTPPRQCASVRIVGGKIRNWRWIKKICEDLIYRKASNLEKPRNQCIHEAQRSSGTGNMRDSPAHIVWNVYKPAMQILSQPERRVVFPTENQRRAGSTFLITSHVSKNTGKQWFQNPNRKHC